MSNTGNAIIFRVGLDTRQIGKDSADLERSVSSSTSRAAATSSRLAKQMAKAHQQAAADIEKAYKESAERVRVATEKEYAKMDRSADLRARAARNNLRGVGAFASGHGGGGGHGGGLSGVGGARVVGDLLDQITGTRGNVMRANMAAHLPRAVGPLLLAMLAGHGIKEQINLSGANDRMENLLGRGTRPMSDRFLPKSFQSEGNASAGDPLSMEALAERRKALQKQIEETRDSRSGFGGFFKTLGSVTANVGTAGFSRMAMGDQTGRSLNLEREAREKIMEIDATIAGRVHDQIAARETLLHKSELEGELAQHRLELAEKLAKLEEQQRSGEIGIQDYTAGRKDAKAQAADADEASQRRAAAAGIDIDLQKQLNQIRARGDEDELEAAERRVEAEKQKAARVAHGTVEQKAAAAAAVDAAETELSLAQRTAHEENQRLATEIRLAGLRASTAEKEAARLDAEHGLIESQMEGVAPKSRKGRRLRADLAKNEEAQDAHSTNVAMQSFDTANALVDAATGQGTGAQQEALRQKIGIEGARLSFMTANPTTATDGKALADQQAKLAGMTREYQQIALERGKSVREAKDELEVTQLQVDRLDKVAAAVREQHELEEKITQAKKDQNDELAETLEKQQQLALQQAIISVKREISDRDGATVGELAGNAMNENGKDAREVQRIEKRMEQMRKRGHGLDEPGEPSASEKIQKGFGWYVGKQKTPYQQLQDRANALRNNNPALKDSEKHKDVLDAQLKKLDEIEKNTKTLGKVR